MRLRDGDPPAASEHSITRKAAREVQRQEPPRWQRTRSSFRERKGDTGQGGLRRRAETAARSTGMGAGVEGKRET